MTMPSLPAENNTAWYSHYSAMHTVVALLIGSTTVGRAVLKAVDRAAARTAISATVVAGSNVSTVAVDDVAGTQTVAVPNASTTVRGAVELATNTETVTGTSTTLAVAPSGVQAAIDNAASSNGLIGVLADTNQTVTNSATLVNDSQMVADLEANAFYHVEVYPVFNLATGGSTTTDLKIAWTFPTGTGGYWNSTNVGWAQPGAASASTGLVVSLATQRDFALQEGDQGVSLRMIVFTGSTAGQLTMRWAQNTANAAALTRYAGSNMLVRKTG